MSMRVSITTVSIKIDFEKAILELLSIVNSNDAQINLPNLRSMNADRQYSEDDLKGIYADIEELEEIYHELSSDKQPILYQLKDFLYHYLDSIFAIDISSNDLA